MKFWKKVLIISVTGIILFTVGYFIEHAVEMSKSVDFESICDKTYISSNEEYQLYIRNDMSVRFVTKDDYFIHHDVKYSDNFLTFMNEEEEYRFYVFDESRIYSQNLKLYLYHYEVADYD